MSRINIIAKRYAKAFAKLFENDPQVGQKHLMALSLLKCLFNMEDARKILGSPVMPRELKLQLIDYALDTGKAEDPVRHFIYSILDANRVGLIPEVIDAYEEILNQYSGRSHAFVTTAVELPSNDRSALQMGLEEIFSKKIDVSTTVNPRILGGFVARVGNTVIDCSIKARLESFTRSVLSQ